VKDWIEAPHVGFGFPLEFDRASLKPRDRAERDVKRGSGIFINALAWVVRVTARG
jgi:hypothetical protein